MFSFLLDIAFVGLIIALAIALFVIVHLIIGIVLAAYGLFDSPEADRFKKRISERIAYADLMMICLWPYFLPRRLFIVVGGVISDFVFAIKQLLDD